MMFLRNQNGNGGAASPEHSPQARGKAAPANWTVLAYLAGHNNLEGPLLGNLQAMERVGSRPGSVEILAQLDRAPGYDASAGAWSGPRRYYVTRSPRPGDNRRDSARGSRPNQHRRSAGTPGLHRLRRATISRAGDDACAVEPRLGLLRPAGDALALAVRRRPTRPRGAAAPAQPIPNLAGVAARPRPAAGARGGPRRRPLPRPPTAAGGA